MIITFCGHRDFVEEDTVKQRLLEILEKEINGKEVTFYLGGYGGFDWFAFRCCREYKQNHNNAKLCLIMAYYNHQRTEYFDSLAKQFDEVIYPPIESVPKRFAIFERNKWMIDKSNLLVAYITHTWGGAYKTLQYAIKRNKKVHEI